MHNGKIGNWHSCRKDIEDLIDHTHYPYREGSTDSEALFLTALSKGLTSDPIKVMNDTFRIILDVMKKNDATEPLRVSCALTNGKEIWAFRYSSDNQSPSMYFGSPHTRSQTPNSNPINTIASEPSDSEASHWFKVDESTGLHWTVNGLEKFSIEN